MELHFESLVSDVQGGRLTGYWHQGASAETLHFLHGNGFAVRSYQRFLAAMTGSENLLLQDAAGHGLSPAGHQFVGWNKTARRFREVIDQQRQQHDFGAFSGIGHSFGGCMTLLMGSHSPSLFKQMVLLDPALFPPRLIWLLRGVQVTGLRRKIPLVRQTRRRRTTWQSYQDVVQNFTGRGTFQGWTDECLADYIHHSIHKGDDGLYHLNCPPWMEAAIFGSFAKGLWKAIKNVQTPTYLIWGESTFDYFRESYQLAANINPNIRLLKVKGGHCFMQEQPQLAGQLVRSILDEGQAGIESFKAKHAGFVIDR